MPRNVSVLTVAIVLLLAMPASAQTGSADLASKSETTRDYTFQLRTLDGVDVAVVDQPDIRIKGTVVCFLGTECPLVKLYSSRLSELSERYATRGIRFVGINSNRQDTDEDIRLYLGEHSLSFPVVRDERNLVADQYGATRTPEVFLLDSQLKLRYQGRIDDQYAPGVTRSAASREDLREAIDQLLDGVPISVVETEAVGCLIGKYRRTSAPAGSDHASVTYSNQVSRMLQKHCLECHRAGEIGPFAMDSYQNVVGWADTMQETIDNGRMPPWHADPDHGSFRNARVMPESDKQILRDWIAAGMPKGNDDELPEPVQFADGWQLGREPDLVVAMSERSYAVSAEGTVEYQYFVVDPGFTEDRWVTAAQVIPGNRSVVHHSIVFIRPPDGSEFRGVGWLTAYVPGQRSFAMPPEHARRIPAGSKLVFQMHYTTNGSPQRDLTRVGMLFAPAEQISHQVITVVGIDQEFEIPPQVADHEVRGQVRWYPKQGRLLAVAPHMHVRGKQFQLYAERDNQSESLLYVPQYDFNWQHAYELSEPLELSEIDRLKFRVVFDNSSQNPFNPDPTQWVTWGDQTWEEMAVAFLEVAEPLYPDPDKDSATVVLASEDPETQAKETAERERKIQTFVDDFFDRLDVNQDGVVLRSEVPLAVRTHFRRYDLDNDNKVSRDDVRQVAEERFPE